MNIRFYVDPETDEPHVYSHEVSEHEVEEIFASGMAEDRQGRGSTRVLLGRTEAGRHLRVIYVPDPEPNSVFVITAYDLIGKPLAAYKRRQRRKG